MFLFKTPEKKPHAECIADVRFFAAAPSGPPLDVSGEATDSDSMLIRWKPPMTSYVNGHILGYQVFYHDVNGNNVEPSVRTLRGRHKLEVSLTGLKQFTRYEVSVRAFNQVGSGPSSTPIMLSTLEGGRFKTGPFASSFFFLFLKSDH